MNFLKVLIMILKLIKIIAIIKLFQKFYLQFLKLQILETKKEQHNFQRVLLRNVFSIYISSDP